ncbi:MAG: amino acid ABC transporter permease [Patescibacteria group bacterium]
MYDWDWNVVLDYKEVFFAGALTTIWLTLFVVVIGTLLGLILGLARRSSILLLPQIARVYVATFRALPILILLIWIYYVVPMVFHIQLSPFYAALLALSINLSAYVAETVRAGIEAIPKNQFDSGITLGLNRTQVMFYIILPQAFRSMLPNLLSLYITQLKNSSLASVIGMNELLHRSNLVISNTYRPLEVYTAVAAIYLAIIIPVTCLAGQWEKRLARKTKNT